MANRQNSLQRRHVTFMASKVTDASTVCSTVFSDNNNKLTQVPHFRPLWGAHNGHRTSNGESGPMLWLYPVKYVADNTCISNYTFTSVIDVQCISSDFWTQHLHEELYLNDMVFANTPTLSQI